MPNKRKNMPDNSPDDRDIEKDIQRGNRNPGGQENRQQDQGGHFGGQHERGKPYDPGNRR
ncbi:MAG: hypothetical protein H7X89_02035 [Rhizobiales bacterium]|nr:hypothetical protein [Hyphomicrobiales bacterium]